MHLLVREVQPQTANILYEVLLILPLDIVDPLLPDLLVVLDLPPLLLRDHLLGPRSVAEALHCPGLQVHR